MNISKAHATDRFPVPDGHQLSPTKVGLLEVDLEQARPFPSLHAFYSGIKGFSGIFAVITRRVDGRADLLTCLLSEAF